MRHTGRHRGVSALMAGLALLLLLGASLGSPAIPRGDGQAEVMEDGGDPGTLLPLPVYRRVTEAAGLDAFLHAGFLGPDPWPYFPETSGPGACWLDYDKDGWLDLYLVNTRYITDAWKNDALDPHSMLFRNNGDGTFTDATTAANARATGYLQGCAAADATNNGYPDLYIAGYGGSVLLLNNGDGTFTDATDAAGVRNADCDGYWCWAVSPAWLDADQDGCLDLFVSHYLDYDLDDPPPYNGPSVGQRNRYYHNNCDGTFTDQTQAAGLAGVKSDTWMATSVDLDNDGWPDIYVANDGDENDVYLNNGDGTFRRLATGILNDGRAGMGTAIADFNHDGVHDIVVTHYRSEHNAVFRSTATGWTDVGSTVPFEDSYWLVGWATHFFDMDNNGHLDLMVLNGETQDLGWFPSRQVILAYQNHDGEVFDAVRPRLGADLQAEFMARGGAWADYDNDGDIDFILAEAGEAPTHLYRADGVGNRFLSIDLQSLQPGVNRDAVGARVTVTADGLPPQMQEKVAGSAFLSSSDPRLHFGLGAADTATLTIRWPDGTSETHTDIRANTFLRATQGTGLETLRVLPLVDLHGPDTPIRRLESTSFTASATSAPGRSIAAYDWDFGDNTTRSGNASETHGFLEIGPLTVRVTATDSVGLARTEWHPIFVYDELEARIEMDKGVFLPTEEPSGRVLVTYSDGDPVRGAQVNLTIRRTTGDPQADALIDALPFFLREFLRWVPQEIGGETGPDGTFTFVVRHNQETPNPFLPASLTHPGAYAATATGGARGSTFPATTIHYHVAVPPT